SVCQAIASGCRVARGRPARGRPRVGETDQGDGMVRNITILGSGPAGLAAAIYAARANLKPLLVEGLQAGGQLMITTDVENYPGFRNGILGPELMLEMKEQAARFGTEMIFGDATRVELAATPLRVHVDQHVIET